jgi:transcriptional regulator of heat shock response
MFYLDNIISFIITKYITIFNDYYIYIYIAYVPFIFILFWFWLSHVDRIQLREKSRLIGVNLNNKIRKKNIVYGMQQLNAIFECCAGITDGLLNRDPIVKVYKLVDQDNQTINNSLYLTDQVIQTDIIKIDIIIDDNEINKSENIFCNTETILPTYKLDDDIIQNKKELQTNINKTRRIQLVKINK